MGKITLNLADDGLVPVGEHLVEVQRTTLHDKIDGTSQYLRFDLLVTGGNADGRTLDCIASLRPDLRRMLAQQFAALGVDAAEVEIETETDDVDTEVVVSPDLVGRRAIATVIHHERGGQTYARVQRLRAVDA
jgi:hypothetical protein